MPDASSSLYAGLPPAAAILPPLLDLLPYGVVYYCPVVDEDDQVIDFRFAYLNPAARRMLGVAQVPTQTHTEQFPTTRHNGGLAFHLATYASGEPGHFEVNYQADGYDNYFRVEAQRVEAGLLVTFSDTAEHPRTPVEVALRKTQAQEAQARVAAETALRHAHEQHALLTHTLEQVPAAVATLRGPEHRYSYFNAQYQALSAGRTVLGHTVAEVYPEVVEQGFVGLLDKVYTTGQPFIGTETPARLHDATTGQSEQRYVDFIYQPLTDAQGAVQGILAFIVDVTEKVQARQLLQVLNENLATNNEQLRVSNEEYASLNTELVQSEHALGALNLALEERVQQRTQEVQRAQAATEVQHALLTHTLEQVPAAVATLHGPEHRFTFFNDQYQTFSAGRVGLALRAADVFPEVVEQGFTALLDQVYATGQPFVGVDTPILLHDTTTGRTAQRYLDFIYQPLTDEQGQVDGILVFVVDVTEKVQTRHRVQQLNDELQASNGSLRNSNHQLTRTNADLDNFIYTASHDLKAPIANIEGLLAAVQHALPAAGRVGEIPTMLELMQHAIERFGRTVGHLTDVARLQQEHSQPTRELALAHVVREVELDLAPLIAQAGAQVEVVVPEAVRLTFSEKNLRSVVYNLLSNALKYRHPDRACVVRLAYRLEGPYPVLEVADNGLGLDLTQGTDKLFGLFQRLHTHVEGTGIGLYMVKKMVENAGGRIEVRSQPGQGATFAVYLPS